MIALWFATLFAQALPLQIQKEPEMAIQNTILTQVNGTTISLLDVTKKMDLLFYQQYPNLKESEAARYQFYASSWRNVLQELVDQELILADALSKEIPLTDAEVREEMDLRFGPNLVLTLDELAISYDDAWKLVKNELIARRMTGHFIYAKALQNVTPQDIRQAYQTYLKEHPPFQQWRYQILTIYSPQSEEIESLSQLINSQKNSPKEALALLKEKLPTVDIQLSNEYSAHTEDLSNAYREALSPLEPHQYSAPLQSSTRGQTLTRLFYLHETEHHQPPSFEELAPQLTNVLLQKAAERESERYLTQLRKRYSFDLTELQASFPEDFHPFLVR